MGEEVVMQFWVDGEYRELRADEYLVFDFTKGEQRIERKKAEDS